MLANGMLAHETAEGGKALSHWICLLHLHYPVTAPPRSLLPESLGPEVDAVGVDLAQIRREKPTPAWSRWIPARLPRSEGTTKSVVLCFCGSVVVGHTAKADTFIPK